jgi:hypothetical protein
METRMNIDRPHKVEFSTIELDEVTKAVMTSVTSVTKKLRRNMSATAHRDAQRSSSALNGALDQLRAVQRNTWDEDRDDEYTD